MLDFSDLSGKRALVTGASSGIGLAVARALADCGTAVAVHYRSGAGAARRLVDDIATAGGRAIAVAADLTDTAAATGMVAEAAAGLGGLDILINNAGVFGVRTPIAEADPALVDALFAANGRALITVTRAALPHLKAAGGGSIINTGSLAARTGGGPGGALYSATKGYVHTLSRGMAREFAPFGIRVNTVAPGVIRTPMHDATSPEQMAAIRAAIPMGRIGTVDECVGTYLFFASPRLSGYLTGQILDVNGGQFMP